MQHWVHQIVLLASLAALSWWGMMAVHELGHVLGAWATGGRVIGVMLSPLAFSRTDVEPNPSPGFVVWAGPIVGVVLPLVSWEAARLVDRQRRWSHLLGFFAGFCLLANGAYIGLGAFTRAADAGMMLITGSPRWTLVLFGLATAPLGLYVWHRLSPRFGFGEAPERISPRLSWATLLVAVVVLLLATMLGGERT